VKARTRRQARERVTWLDFPRYARDGWPYETAPALWDERS
jgi:hypothetical protein